MSDFRIPYNFKARDYQIPFLRAVEASINGESKVRKFMQVWHRRSGKDKVDIADVMPRKLVHDPCLGKFVYPTLKMARENMWDGIGSDGFRYREHIAPFIREGEPNESTMKIPVKHGSIFQLAGSDNPDSLRGGNPKIYVFSEWAEQNPYAWDVVEPILRENDGIAIFNFTPKGDNHARSLYEYAKGDPDNWFVQILTAEDTGIWTLKQLDEIRLDIIKRFAADGRSESEATAYFDQEYMCSFKAPVIGSYYGANIATAEKTGRITNVPHMDGFPVDTYWDLGIDDSMTIWFCQEIGQELHLIDYYENSGEGFPFYAQELQKRGYMYRKHVAPHDISVRELGTGKSRLEIASTLGIRFDVAPSLSVDDGINACRTIFSQCWFDKDKTIRGINALKNYRKEWDEKNKVFRNNPKHDWASHGADGFRTFGVGYQKYIKRTYPTDVGGVKGFIPGIG
jgi:hypothetical protein